MILSLHNQPPTSATHFTAYLFASVQRVAEQLAIAFEGYDALLEQCPFLADYAAGLDDHGLSEVRSAAEFDAWFAELRRWEARACAHLPLRSLREACGLDDATLSLMLCVGLVEEDPRWGPLCAAMQDAPGQHRPTVALLQAWWRGGDDQQDARGALRQLSGLGLLRYVNPDAPRLEQALAVPAPIWDALHGESPLLPGAKLRRLDELACLETLVLPDELRSQLDQLPDLLAAGEIPTLIVRGPQRNGRRTVLGAIARELGRGLLELPSGYDESTWRLAGPLATLLHALPVAVLDPPPGVTIELPDLVGGDGPLGIVCGRQGGIGGAAVERSLTIELPLPSLTLRHQLWQRFVPAMPGADREEIAERWRITSGNLQRAATLARSIAALEARDTSRPDDVRQALRSLNRQSLDLLAERVRVDGDWNQLVLGGTTLSELEALLARCRHRERLGAAVGDALAEQLTPGVRALLAGPSGTGKTLAARALAAELGMDLYRVDLATVVNKYIGETEKNLSQLFARAEELDVILLLDEGDALLTRRTAVQSSNDRYANLETNFLLQRLESYEGILLVTTNAAERIDGAFQRRMDVVLQFRPPDAAERWTIWQLHLPARHRVDPLLLDEIVARCLLTGGQIRNAALHAAVLALDDGGVVGSEHLASAVQREYRKIGALCPLRPFVATPGG